MSGLGGITGIAIIGAAVIADTFGTTASTGVKSNPFDSLSWLAIATPAQFFYAGAALQQDGLVPGIVVVGLEQIIEIGNQFAILRFY